MMHRMLGFLIYQIYQRWHLIILLYLTNIKEVGVNMEVIKEKNVIIRKKHKCSLCLREFVEGSEMNVQTIKEDSLYDVYCCLTCKELTEFMDTYDDAYREGQTLEEMFEYKFDGTPESFLNYLRKLESFKRSF